MGPVPREIEMQLRSRMGRFARTISLAAILGLGAASSAAASVTYEYTGLAFDTASAPYTTANFVTVELVLSEPLPANALPGQLVNWTDLLESWSFSDGVQTINSGDPDTSFLFDSIAATDGASLPTVWTLDLRRGNPLEGAVVTRNDGGQVLDLGFLSSGGAGQILNSAGSWVIVPAPSSVPSLGVISGILTAGALAGLWVARRRKNA